MKGAGRRRRQLQAVLWSGYGQGFLIVISMLAFIHTVGLDFLIASSNGAFGVPVAPYAQFFVGVTSGSTLVGALLGVALICCIPPWLYANAAIAYRVPFAWSFDGLSPSRFTERQLADAHAGPRHCRNVGALHRNDCLGDLHDVVLDVLLVSGSVRILHHHHGRLRRTAYAVQAPRRL